MCLKIKVNHFVALSYPLNQIFSITTVYTRCTLKVFAAEMFVTSVTNISLVCNDNCRYISASWKPKFTIPLLLIYEGLVFIKCTVLFRYPGILYHSVWNSWFMYFAIYIAIYIDLTNRSDNNVIHFDILMNWPIYHLAIFLVYIQTNTYVNVVQMHSSLFHYLWCPDNEMFLTFGNEHFIDLKSL